MFNRKGRRLFDFVGWRGGVAPTSVSLIHADATGADLREFVFAEPLSHVWLSYADLRGTRFSALHEVTLNFALADERTVWPSGCEVPEGVITMAQGNASARFAAARRLATEAHARRAYAPLQASRLCRQAARLRLEGVGVCVRRGVIALLSEATARLTGRRARACRR